MIRKAQFQANEHLEQGCQTMRPAGDLGPTKHRKELQGTTRNYKVLLNLQNA